MVKNVYWTITYPFDFNGRRVVFLRFGSTGKNPDIRVRGWKNYCPLPLSVIENVPHILSVDRIGGLAPDDAVRRYALLHRLVSRLLMKV